MEILVNEQDVVKALKEKGAEDYKIVRNQPTITVETLPSFNLSEFVQGNFSETEWEFVSTEVDESQTEKEEFQIVWGDYGTVFMTSEELENIVKKAFG
ncbi:hypothetical protein ACF0HT_14005 (plasmid) [Staphylococcus xylosus]|uniref:hypothetical protein n=1 Tax=Staphylococcus xylosus TaxID=1288 RepID=UPI003747826C